MAISISCHLSVFNTYKSAIPMILRPCASHGAMITYNDTKDINWLGFSFQGGRGGGYSHGTRVFNNKRSEFISCIVTSEGAN